ncbi:hypothetical protein [Vibrio tapetis]|uniref:Glycine zipper domain-containing protein n=1 Tax=Vibrio tapetis subsp. tapetis TaxID=1671868 RepID=A0A2N8ZJM8_9VIBR|nr:hypothetical protein [Vibrio tapetis]SON52124.1 conserved exported protein of unknown function [Vibrio tapetis subsp. tapetis]
MMKKSLIALLAIFSANTFALCESGNSITDAVEGAVVGGVVGAVVGDAGAGAAIGATAGVIDGAYADVECEEAIGDHLVADAIEDEYERELVEDAIIEDAIIEDALY